MPQSVAVATERAGYVLYRGIISIVDMIIPTFGPPIPTSSFNFIVLVLQVALYSVHACALGQLLLRIFSK